MNTLYHYVGLVVVWTAIVGSLIIGLYFASDYLLSKLLKILKMYHVFIEFIWDRERYKAIKRGDIEDED